MNYAVNYIFPEVMNFTKPDDTYIKYPGGKWDFDTLKDLISKSYKVVLHGIIPSSGSILDPMLCDHISEFYEIAKNTNQKWLSFHFERKDKYEQADIDDVIQSNITKIHKYFGDIQLLIENMPTVDGIQSWCCEPSVISKYCKKYNFGLLLDIPHSVISAQYFKKDVKDYINEFPLSIVKEIHLSGWSRLNNGKLYDSHIECNQESYELLKYVINKTENCEMISLEYAPSRDYDGESVAKEYREKRSYEELYIEQQRQLKKIKEIVMNSLDSKKI